MYLDGKLLASIYLDTHHTNHPIKIYVHWDNEQKQVSTTTTSFSHWNSYHENFSRICHLEDIRGEMENIARKHNFIFDFKVIHGELRFEIPFDMLKIYNFHIGRIIKYLIQESFERFCRDHNITYFSEEHKIKLFTKNDIYKKTLYSKENEVNIDDLSNFLYGVSKNNLRGKKVGIYKLIRDSVKASFIRNQYDKCQIIKCSSKVKSSRGEFIKEAHHIQQYNQKHGGDDCTANLIVLCPNCHAQFDDLYYAIDPETLLVHCLDENDEKHLSEIHLLEWHHFGKDYLDYVWYLFLKNKRNNSKYFK